MTKIILGLGNPGAQYARTRHNVGFRTADALARRCGIRLDTRRNRSRLGEGRLGETPVVIAKPQTFMNLSGDAAVSLLARYRARPEDLVVICDDINLPLGTVRVRASGSAGGHNGLKSIIARLGCDSFPRVRIGISGPTTGPWIDYVLGEFSEEELALVEEAIERAADAVAAVVQESAEAAANKFNRRNPPPGDSPT